MALSLTIVNQRDNYMTIEALFVDEDINRHDQFGPDPFGFRRVQVPRIPETEFADILKHHDKAGLAVEAPNDYPNRKDLIPNRIHYIYIVNPLTDANRKETMLRFKKNNPEYATTLWIDSDVYTSEQLKDLLDWAKTNSIHILDVNEIMTGRMGDLEGIYHMEHTLKHIGAASDLLRIQILREFGGIYSDPDALNEKPLGDVTSNTGHIFKCNCSIKNTKNKHPLAMKKGQVPSYTSGSNNDLMFATPAHEQIIAYEGIQRSNYKGPLVTTPGFKVWQQREKYYLTDIPTESYNYRFALYCTGPGIIGDQTFIANNANKASLSVVDKFIFGSEISWNKNRTHQMSSETNEIQVKFIITSLIHYLSIDKYTLRLDQYNAFNNTDNLMQAIEFIAKNYPELLTSITTIHAHEDNYPLNLLLNKTIFPALKEENILNDCLNKITKSGNLNLLQEAIKYPAFIHLVSEKGNQIARDLIYSKSHNKEIYDFFLDTVKQAVWFNKELLSQQSLFEVYIQNGWDIQPFIEQIINYSTDNEQKFHSFFDKLKNNLQNLSSEEQKLEFKNAQTVYYFLNTFDKIKNTETVNPSLLSTLEQIREHLFSQPTFTQSIQQLKDSHIDLSKCDSSYLSANAAKIICKTKIMEMVKHLSESAQIKRHDRFGPDPFGLRIPQSPHITETDFTTLLNKHDKSGLPVEPQNDDQNRKDLIPNRMHFIYIVNPLTDASRKETMVQFKRNNPDYATTLWTDLKAYSPEQLNELLEWAKTNSLHVLDVNEIMTGRMGELEGIYHLEHDLKHVGVASDLLRIQILKAFRGIYSDPDVVNIEALGEVVEENGCLFNYGYHINMSSDNHHPLVAIRDNKAIRNQFITNNDILMANAQTHQLIDFENKQISHLSSPLQPFLGERIILEKENLPYSIDLPTRTFNMIFAIYCTGPGILQEIKEDHSYQLPTPSVFNKFIFGCELSWNKDRPIQLQSDSAEKQIQLIITGLLHDLIIEPEVLRLDQYNEFNQDNQLETAIVFIKKNYPDAFSNIKRVYANKDNHPISVLLDRNIFPLLDHNKLIDDYLVRMIETHNINLINEVANDPLFFDYMQKNSQEVGLKLAYDRGQYTRSDNSNYKKINKIFSRLLPTPYYLEKEYCYQSSVLQTFLEKGHNLGCFIVQTLKSPEDPNPYSIYGKLRNSLDVCQSYREQVKELKSAQIVHDFLHALEEIENSSYADSEFVERLRGLKNELFNYPTFTEAIAILKEKNINLADWKYSQLRWVAEYIKLSEDIINRPTTQLATLETNTHYPSLINAFILLVNEVLKSIIKPAFNCNVYMKAQAKSRLKCVYDEILKNERLLNENVVKELFNLTFTSNNPEVYFSKVKQILIFEGNEQLSNFIVENCRLLASPPQSFFSRYDQTDVIRQTNLTLNILLYLQGYKQVLNNVSEEEIVLLQKSEIAPVIDKLVNENKLPANFLKQPTFFDKLFN